MRHISHNRDLSFAIAFVLSLMLVGIGKAAQSSEEADQDEGPHTFVFESPEDAADLVSADCLMCHEVSETTEAGPHARRGPDGKVRLDHPYAVAYQPTRRNSLRAPAEAIPGGTGQIADLLRDGKVECTSCHAVFRSAALPETPLLRSEFGALRNLCVSCHRM